MSNEGSFTFTTTNKIMMLVLLLGLFFITPFSKNDNSSYQYGEYVGRALGCFIWPALLSWVIWKFSGKRNAAGAISFNILIVLVLLSQVGLKVHQSNEFRLNQEAKNITKSQNKFKSAILKSTDIGTFEDSYANFRNEMTDSIQKMIGIAKGVEKEFYVHMLNFIKLSLAKESKWEGFFNNVYYDGFINYSDLKENNTYDEKRDLLDLFENETIEFKNFHDRRVEILEELMGEVVNHDIFIKGSVGMKKKIKQQQKIISPIMLEYLDYSKNVKEILWLLEKNDAEWTFDDDKVVISNDQLLKDFIEIAKSIDANHEEISKLSNKLMTVL